MGRQRKGEGRGKNRKERERNEGKESRLFQNQRQVFSEVQRVWDRQEGLSILCQFLQSLKFASPPLIPYQPPSRESEIN